MATVPQSRPLFDHWFTSHPRSVGESYRQHMAIAASVGGRLLVAGLACFVHALVPRLFMTTGSRAIGDLHREIVAARSGEAGER